MNSPKLIIKDCTTDCELREKYKCGTFASSSMIICLNPSSRMVSMSMYDDEDAYIAYITNSKFGKSFLERYMS